MKKDWITKFNETIEKHKLGDDRLLVEYFIMFLDEVKQGDKFYAWFNKRAEDGQIT